jgi:hypothetical protein
VEHLKCVGLAVVIVVGSLSFVLVSGRFIEHSHLARDNPVRLAPVRHETRGCVFGEHKRREQSVGEERPHRLLHGIGFRIDRPDNRFRSPSPHAGVEQHISLDG